MTTYLDLDAPQAASLARGERVERWVPWEKQPPKRFKDAVVITNGERYALSYAPSITAPCEAWPPNPEPGLLPPHPPGTRARVNTGAPTQAGGVTVRVGAIIIAVCKSVTPEVRGGEYGFVKGWEKC